jgi:endoglucanase
MEGKKLLFELSNTPGISGYEEKIFNISKGYFEEYVDEFLYGKLGDMAAVKRGCGEKRLKIMLAAHADEVGLIVKDINERGFVYFTRVSGVDSKTLPAQEVIIHGKKDIYGVIGAKPPHVLTQEDMKKAVKMEDMVIDTGLSEAEIKEYVSIGDLITLKRECKNLLGDCITGKALDDRAGICAMAECAKYLQKLKHTADVYFTATTMEETGSFGAKTMSYNIDPDIGIAIDVTFGDKYAGERIQGECGKGVEITVGPNIHPELSQRLVKIAKENNISYYIDVAAGHTGTDAWNIQTAREGIPTLLISIPLKYMHTSTEVINYKDVELAGKLLALFISSVDSFEDIYSV